MFYEFIRKNGIAIFAIMFIIVIFLLGTLSGFVICLKHVEKIETQATIQNSAPSVTKPQIDENAVVDVSSPVNMGEFKITAYCPCKSCSGEWGRQTSTGAIATEGRTVAVDPSVIPYGSTVIINGAEYVAEDCGGLIKGNKIDIYFESHKEAKQFGVQKANIFLKP